MNFPKNMESELSIQIMRFKEYDFQESAIGRWAVFLGSDPVAISQQATSNCSSQEERCFSMVWRYAYFILMIIFCNHFVLEESSTDEADVYRINPVYWKLE
jgi:hypothetical protein